MGLFKVQKLHLKGETWANPKYLPYAFTELGVAMLSSVLNSEIEVEVNISIMRAFVAICGSIISSGDMNVQLWQEVKELQKYIEEVFTDQNDINEDTRVQIELINQALAELQVKNKEREKKERPRIGFIKPKEE